MKKLISAVLSGAMLVSVFLSGCAGVPKDTDAEETEVQTEETTTTTTTEPEAHIDEAKLKQLADMYTSKVPDKKHALLVFDESIRGQVMYSFTEDYIYFGYSSFNSLSQLTLHIRPQENYVSLDFTLEYGDTRYYGTSSSDFLGYDGFEAFIDDVMENNPSTVRIYDDSGWEGNQENIKKDLPIVYSRFIKLANVAFPELGFGLEDIGLDFGDKYRNIDPTQCTSQEVEVKNEHKFVNGVCEDCGMLWVDYFYDAIGKLDRYPGDSSWRSIYGQRSSSMFDTGDYVQLQSYGRKDADLYYQHSIMKDPESTGAGQHIESCRLVVNQNKKKTSSSLVFEYEEGEYSVGQGIVDFKFRYYLRVEAKDGDYSKVFESKESLLKNSEIYLFVTGKDGVGSDVLGSKKDAEIKKMFDEIPFTTYYTKEEFVEMVLKDYYRMFESMDKGMIWMDTSLADAGIKYKKEN